jgi:hypothetical protein
MLRPAFRRASATVDSMHDGTDDCMHDVTNDCMHDGTDDRMHDGTIDCMHCGTDDRIDGETVDMDWFKDDLSADEVASATPDAASKSPARDPERSCARCRFYSAPFWAETFSDINLNTKFL